MFRKIIIDKIPSVAEVVSEQSDKEARDRDLANKLKEKKGR